MSSDDLPLRVRDSRWWYWIAAVPILYILVFAVLAVFVLPLILGESTVVFGLGESSVALLAVALSFPTFLITLALPYALYRDIGLLDEHDTVTAWSPDQDEYAILGAAGIFVTGVSVVVSVYYLYRRHVHVGIP